MKRVGMAASSNSSLSGSSVSSGKSSHNPDSNQTLKIMITIIVIMITVIITWHSFVCVRRNECFYLA